MKSTVQLISFSMPNSSSSGRPVSLQVGKGMYVSWPDSSVICSPESLENQSIQSQP